MRSIPACAGEPVPVQHWLGPQGVYPRVCGGTSSPQFIGAISHGLSPRVRGNHSVAASIVQLLGSIPACAGEPADRVGPRTPSKVYPRVCGGTPLTPPPHGTSPGLSPRVRGNRASSDFETMEEWSIPACAGEPARDPVPDDRMPVYPRVCGGTYGRGVADRSFEGLSPRVRGNPHPTKEKTNGTGSIPACAGEPGWIDAEVAIPEVYPRVCGGTCATRRRPATVCGLSPRVRGNQHDRAPCRIDDRSIPACAGEPPSANGS